jgi:hypothetical protein
VGTTGTPAILPNGSDVYLVYNAFTTPFRVWDRGVERHDAEPDAEAPVAPAVAVSCPAAFGNSGIFGASIVDPTP